MIPATGRGQITSRSSGKHLSHRIGPTREWARLSPAKGRWQSLKRIQSIEGSERSLLETEGGLQKHCRLQETKAHEFKRNSGLQMLCGSVPHVLTMLRLPCYAAFCISSDIYIL
jgi:hypothetical protein